MRELNNVVYIIIPTHNIILPLPITLVLTGTD